MRKFWIVFVLVAVVIGGGLGLLWKAATSLNGPTVTGGGLLHWQAGGSFPEVTDDSVMGQLRHGDDLPFRQVVNGLDRAAVDPDIKGLILDLQGLAVSWAQLEELHAAVRRFADHGKPVWASVTFAGNADYALATAADRIAMAPEGILMVLGVVAELAFLKDTLAKAGIEADFLHVGEYKSAPEQLTRREASEANRAMTISLVDERYDLLVDLVATGRDRPADDVRAWIDVGMHDAPLAFASGMVDTVLDLEDLLDGFFADEDVTEFVDYARGGGKGRATHEIALVVAEGTIYPGESRVDNFQGPIVGSDTVIDQLSSAREDDDIEAVLLRVNSPGGSALASDLIWREVERVRKIKPVVVSMGGYAASGGYYISCGADSIFADRGTLTGSIGVFAGKMNWSGLYEKIDLHREFVTRGENALLWSDAVGFTVSQRQLFQSQLDRFYERFLDKVAQGRGMDRDAVDAVARGRVWTGRQALEHGLVDGLGGISRALNSVKRLIGAETDEKVRMHTYGKELSWFERALVDVLQSRGAWPTTGDGAPLAALPGPWGRAAEGLIRCGLADVVPLLDGRPLALMTWWPVDGGRVGSP